MTSPTDPPTQTRAATGPSGVSGPGESNSEGSKSGAIVLARHGEPALSRRLKLDARGYDRWWATYEAGGILTGQVPPQELIDHALRADVIFASIRLRAIETARAVAGGKAVREDPMFIEAPLPAPATPRFVKLSPKTWGVVSRFLWWFGYHRGQETRRQAQARARTAAERLIVEAEAGRNVLVLAHGFFNGMVGVELSRRGWRCVQDRGFKYWATRRFERE
ncbi:histidine phosphatase family protein [Caulobacter sp. S45]|uniref:histidine phosphatase family protein n=1 Tax=Caulobacter sp. S45 TaxID=1641861 RepID=UPI00131A6F0F|nr:histidine phosphatase family protein [Caulobacter sp. S45]